MKRAVLLVLFFGISVLCCYAQERKQIDESNNALPSLSLPGLSAQAMGFGFLTVDPALSASSLEWQQMDLGLTRYADYETVSFFDVAKPVFQWGLILGGLAVYLVGLANYIDGPGDSYEWLGIEGVGLFALTAGLTWLIIDP